MTPADLPPEVGATLADLFPLPAHPPAWSDDAIMAYAAQRARRDAVAAGLRQGDRVVAARERAARKLVDAMQPLDAWGTTLRQLAPELGRTVSALLALYERAEKAEFRLLDELESLDAGSVNGLPELLPKYERAAEAADTLAGELRNLGASCSAWLPALLPPPSERAAEAADTLALWLWVEMTFAAVTP